jgi:osomolarity two-component system response regulator SSK1
MGDLLRNSRNKLLRRLTAHGSVSVEEPTNSTPPTTVTPASPPSKKPTTATPVYRPVETPILEQPKPLPANKTAFNPSVAPAVVVQEATPPPVPRVPPPAKSSSIVRANSPRPGPDRKVAFSGGVTARPQPPPGTTAKTLTPPTKKDSSNTHIGAQPQMMTMSRRKVWIKRPGASPTLVQINHDDVVDEVRDMVLRKYANSLGRTFDAPDVTIKIVPRERTQRESERVLNPEESITLILDTYYPGGQGVDEALLVDVTAKRTPKPSPRIMNQMSSYFDDARPAENDGDYFSSIPVASPNANGVAAGNRRPSIQHAFHPHSMAILETGLLPALHSPGIRKHRERPR